MKTTKFFWIMLALLSFQQVSVQAGGAGGIGIKGGLTISTIGLDSESAETQKNKYRLGGTGGLSYEIATDGPFAFDVELIYDLRGTKIVSDVDFFGNNVGNNVFQTYFHYITVPASFKFYIGDVFNVNFGGYTAFLAGGKAKNVFTPNVGDQVTSEHKIFDKDLEIDGEELFNRFDAGIHFGLEFVSTKGFGVGTRFSKGLVNVNNEDHPLVSGRATTTEISVYGIVRLAKKNN
jgi:hypothetical protein